MKRVMTVPCLPPNKNYEPTLAKARVTFGPVEVDHNDDYIFFANTVTGWQGEVWGDAAKAVLKKMYSQSHELNLIKFASIGNFMGGDMSTQAKAAFQ